MAGDPGYPNLAVDHHSDTLGGIAEEEEEVAVGTAEDTRSAWAEDPEGVSAMAEGDPATAEEEENPATAEEEEKSVPAEEEGLGE
jgi:hypothetical protein